MTAIEKSYMEALKGLEKEKIKLRKGKIWTEYQQSFPTSEI